MCGFQVQRVLPGPFGRPKDDLAGWYVVGTALGRHVHAHVYVKYLARIEAFP